MLRHSLARAMAKIEAVPENQTIWLWKSAHNLAAQHRLEIARHYQNQFDRLDQEFPNLQEARARLANQQHDVSAHLLIGYVKVLAPYLQQRGLDAELLQWCNEGLTACQRLLQNPGWLLLCQGGAQNRLGLWDEAKDSFLAAVAASREHDAQIFAKATLELGRLQLNQGDYQEALETLAKAETLLDDPSAYESLAAARSEVAAYHLNRGELDPALALYQEADQLRRRTGAAEPSDHILMMLGVVYRKKGKYERAIYYLQQLLARGEAQGNQGAIASAAHHLAWTFLNLEDLSQARRYCGRAIALYKEMNDPRGLSDTYEQLGMILLAEGRPEEAVAKLEQSLTVRRQLGNQHGAASSLRHLALGYWQMGRRITALRKMLSSLELYWQLGMLSRYRISSIMRELFEWLIRRRRWTM